MVDFKGLDAARKLLGLNEVATAKEIKDAYRRLSHRYHPDKNGSDGGEAMKETNRAFELIMAYIDKYQYSFRASKYSAKSIGFVFRLFANRLLALSSNNASRSSRIIQLL